MPIDQAKLIIAIETTFQFSAFARIKIFILFFRNSIAVYRNLFLGFKLRYYITFCLFIRVHQSGMTKHK